MSIEQTNRENQTFWNELCGTHMAQAMGVKPHSPESLQRFDDQYLAYYDYIMPKLQPFMAPGAKILEVGLGYGTVGQTLAQQGCDYLGMDIAKDPVIMMNARLGALNTNGKAVQQNFLKNSLHDESLDVFVSIGCLHHTGSLDTAISEVKRLLKPGGAAVIMTYNRFSYRQWQNDTLATLRAAVKELTTSAHDTNYDIKKSLGCYDTNSQGKEAPFTEFSSAKRLKSLFKNFSSVKVKKENCADEVFFGKQFLRPQLRPFLGPLCGLDLYTTAIK